jgi:hypothetical protein
MPACCCSDSSCRTFGCKMNRPAIPQWTMPGSLPVWPAPVYVPPLPQGCICPPTSEQTCQNGACPRKGVSQ